MRMKIAVPLFQNRISPRFDCAETFLLAIAEKGEIVDRVKIPAAEWIPGKRVDKLKHLGVDTLICGGIDEISARGLIFDGISSFSWVTGDVEDALKTLLRGELASGIMVGPGGRLCGRWRFWGHREHGDNA
jgi:predicted Fe-Mo cluster-binding NifX family protein